jgi:adenine-specific DNA-methyltransferase
MKPTKLVKAFKHKDAKRAHIPSGEEAGYEAGSTKVKEAGAIELPLNPVITRGQDPELFWMHKYGSDEKLTAQLDELQAKLKAGDTAGARTALELLRDVITHRYEQPDDESLHVDIRSLYRHEHIAPETLIKGLYRLVVEKTANQDELFAVNELFGNAIGHEELDKVSDYYTHSDGWTNRLIQGDSLLVMTSLLEREGMTGQVQCIYLDPPYGIKYGSNWQIKLNNRTVKDGDDESLSGQPEQVKAFRDTWELGIHSYLTYLRERLIVARELLHESGSCFVQISDENVHLVRNLMDEVFGSENFVSIIPFRKKTMPLGAKHLESICDYLLWYGRDIEKLKFRNLYQPMAVEGDTHWNCVEFADGTRRKMTKEEINNHKLLPVGSTPYQLVSLYPAGLNQTGLFTFRFGEKDYRPPEGNSWFTHEDGMKRLAEAGRIEPYADGETLRYVLKLSDSPITTLTNFWSDTSAPTGKVYSVQTSTKVLQRCILLTTDPGDLVLDPTCGSGTTAYISEQWGRRWITTDTSRIAINIAKSRLMMATFPYYQLYDQQNCDIRQGFVYKKVPYISKGSVANSEPPVEETLYDQPQEDKKRLRVAGPFTVETLQSYEPISPEELARQRTEDKELGNFEDLIFAHLKSAGVKTGVKEENAVFVRIDRLANSALHAEGWYMAEAGRTPVGRDSVEPISDRSGGGKTSSQTSHGSKSAQYGDAPLGVLESRPTVEKKAYLHIGPKFGTVSKQAVTEAIKACRDKRDGDWLLILGFAFESGITELSRSFGNFQVSIVRMHDDLLQTGLLKKDKKAASFVTIGEPDIRLKIEPVPCAQPHKGLDDEPCQGTVEIAGLDIYDPIKDEVKSRDVHDIAYWMVDDDYDGSNFVVRQVFFCGGDKDEFDEWKRGLSDIAKAATKKKAEQTLKVEIDDEAFTRIYGHTSHPFPVKKGQKIAVRVISQFGEETTKVLEV